MHSFLSAKSDTVKEGTDGDGMQAHIEMKGGGKAVLTEPPSEVSVTRLQSDMSMWYYYYYYFFIYIFFVHLLSIVWLT